jgi:hypothetical protein
VSQRWVVAISIPSHLKVAKRNKTRLFCSVQQDVVVSTVRRMGCVSNANGLSKEDWQRENAARVCAAAARVQWQTVTKVVGWSAAREHERLNAAGRPG